MNKVKSTGKYLLDKIILTPLKYFIPVKNLIIFESFSDYCDSSKTVYERIKTDPDFIDFKFIWLVDFPDSFRKDDFKNTKFIKIGFKGFLRLYEEVRNFYLISRASSFFYTHRSIARTAPKKSQKFINLTHGTSLKDTSGKHPPYQYNTYTTVTSEFTKDLRCKTYGGGSNQMIKTGLPRNDYLFESLDNELLEKLGLKGFSKLIFWMPTFRRQKGKDRNDTNSNKSSDIPLLDTQEDWEEINQKLKLLNILLVVKPHPAQKVEYIKKINLSNIAFIMNEDLVEKNIDLYKIVGKSDALISDYSSIYIDYLLLNRQIAFTIDDFSLYQENLGFTVPDPLKYMPGDKLKTKEDLLVFFHNISDNIDHFREERQTIRNLFHSNKDGEATERIVNIAKM